jgi:hypothetical protein
VGRCSDEATSRPVVQGYESIPKICSRDYDDDLERQEDERACNLMKQQVTTVTSSRECVDDQRSQAPSDVQNITIQKIPAKRQKVGRRSNSPTCVSWTSPFRGKG